MSKIIEQIDKIESIFRLLNSLQIYTFGVFCAERQWLIYEKASVGKQWDNKKLYREMLDAVWDWLLGKTVQPQNYSKLCEEAIIENIDDDKDTFASEVSVSFYNLIFSIENNIPEDTFQTIKHSLNAIDFFLLDFVLYIPASISNDLLVDSHELVINEIGEEDYCIEVLLNPNFTEKQIKMLRERATGQSILGNYWFE